MDLLQLGLEAEIPIAQRGIADRPELGGIDAHVEVVAGMLQEGAHAAVEAVGVGCTFAHAHLVEPVLVLDVVELLLLVVLCRSDPSELEIVGRMVVEGHRAEKGVVFVRLAAVEIDIELQGLGGRATEGGGARRGDETVGIACPDGQHGEVERGADAVAEDALKVGIGSGVAAFGVHALEDIAVVVVAEADTVAEAVAEKALGESGGS